MKKTLKKDNLFLLVFGFLLVMFIAIYIYENSLLESNYYEPVPLATHSNGKHFAGSQSCMECHADIFASHSRTSHYSSSAPADTASIKGSFKVGNNFYYLNDSTKIELVIEESSIYELVLNEASNTEMAKLKIDVVIGSGTKGQSYLTWKGNELYQVQASYFKPTDSWTNSPGMDTERIGQLRDVNSKCMECHTTFAKSTALYGMGHEYDRSKIIFGIDCERCHGPSLQHVMAHRAEPFADSAKSMVLYDTLTREDRMDMCALCHSGVRSNIQPAFSFLVGNRLKEYSLPDKSVPIENVDVHGNQDALLRASKCFKQTKAMDCTTCHNPHTNRRGDSSYFNSKCIECHQTNEIQCEEDKIAVKRVNNNCIACHMPLTSSNSMFIGQKGDSIKTAVKVRTHHIKTYPDL